MLTSPLPNKARLVGSGMLDLTGCAPEKRKLWEIWRSLSSGLINSDDDQALERKNTHNGQAKNRTNNFLFEKRICFFEFGVCAVKLVSIVD